MERNSVNWQDRKRLPWKYESETLFVGKRVNKRQLVRKKITNLKESKEGFIFPGRSMVFQFIVKLEKLDR